MGTQLYGIYGASGCGRGVMPFARRLSGPTTVGAGRVLFIDDNLAGTVINGHPVVSYPEFVAVEASERHVTIAVADGASREMLWRRCVRDGIKAWTVAAPNVVIFDDVQVGAGAVLCPFVTLTSNIRIGMHFHANLYSYVEHDCIIGDYVTFAPSVKCNGNVVIEDYAYIGAGAVLRQGRPRTPLVIGRNAVVGMGAVVTKDVPAGATVVGNPARVHLQEA